MGKHILLSGYYGFRNAGDEAVCFSVIQALRAEVPDCEITVLSHDPAFTQDTLGVHAVNRWKLSCLIRAMRCSDLFISGGGSLLQDITSRSSILYYLGTIFLAKIFRVPCLIYGQGIGPVAQSVNQRFMAKILNGVQGITVRDPESRRVLQDCGVQKKIFVTPDPVLGIDRQKINPQVGRRLLERAGWRGEHPLIICAPRPWKDEDRVPVYAEALDQLAEEGYDILLLSMYPQEERALCQAIANQMTHRAYVFREEVDTESLVSLFAQAEMVIAMRLHALIMGAVGQDKLLAISYDPKVKAFMSLVQSSDILNADGIKACEIVNAAKKVLEGEGPNMDRIDTLGKMSRVPAKFAKILLI